MDGILGPVATNPMYFKEDFLYEDITKYGGSGEVVEEYHAKVAHRLCEFIDQVTLKDGGKKNYFNICIPCYNESMDDLMKTVLCLLENIDFMKHEGKKEFLLLIHLPLVCLVLLGSLCLSFCLLVCSLSYPIPSPPSL